MHFFHLIVRKSVWWGVLITLFLISTGLYSQDYHFTNSGYNVVVQGNSYVNITTGDYINRQADTVDGKVDLDGTIILSKGNFTNYATNNVFINIEPSPDGNVLLNSKTTIQKLNGTTPSHFEDLTVEYKDKLIDVNKCEVNGILNIDAVVNLNRNKLIIDNSDPSGINYISKYLFGETPYPYGEIQWNIGNRIDKYEIPFGTGYTNYNDINLTLATKTLPSPASGNISFATYPTNSHNDPLHFGVNHLHLNPYYVADRYWAITPEYLIKPNIDIIFKYTDDDIDGYENAQIIESELKAYRFNTIINSWEDWGPDGIDNPVKNTVTVSNVDSDEFHAPWMLAREQNIPVVWIPSSFSPNSDGTNDVFIPKLNFEVIAYRMAIYNRWGELIFMTNKEGEGWDGKFHRKGDLVQQGVYVYHITAKGILSIDLHKTGLVTLIK